METKPGVYTTEFWVATLTVIAQLVAALTSNLSPHWAAIGAAVVAGLYAVGRGLAKQGVAPNANVPATTRIAPRRKHVQPRG